jgi:hypothetical protein
MEYSNLILNPLEFIIYIYIYISLDNKKTTDFTKGAAKKVFHLLQNGTNSINLTLLIQAIFMFFIKNAVIFKCLAGKTSYGWGFIWI